MKVIMIGSHLRVNGGITRVVKNYFEAGLDNKVQLEYFPTYYGMNHFINILFYIIQYFKFSLKLFIFKEKFDVAHIHMSYKGSFTRKRLFINLLNAKKVPIILHMHGSQFKDFFGKGSEAKKRQITETLNKVNVIIALGREWKEYYESICNSRVLSLDNAVFPKKINNNQEKVYITTMGVLSKRKGTYDLVEVASKVKGKIDRKYKFLLAGDGEIENVKKVIKEKNVEDMFVIPGWISDENKIEGIYLKSIVYVLPSYNEGMPMSILEAMSYGLPIISTNVGSINSVVKDDNGYIVNPGDTEALAQRLLEILNNPQNWGKYQENNSKEVESKYNIYNSIENLKLIYQSLI
ncbi:glycosyl transferase [Bacillus sp. FJAT-27225]|uniref:glycosyltransferase family 4 protein n=1 Tax=Bacillus sp. FJAT-27225 TaxID=1743144 RepID=UPI00080C206D|nr:glycosyltransferase family 4 protein [Bacillus sp. FJAT-27225]OCA87892.1 glycosyl transferase [Bacillus sp. FJAT-27225]